MGWGRVGKAQNEAWEDGRGLGIPLHPNKGAGRVWDGLGVSSKERCGKGFRKAQNEAWRGEVVWAAPFCTHFLVEIGMVVEIGHNLTYRPVLCSCGK